MDRLTSNEDDISYLCNYLNRHSNFDGNRIKAIHKKLAEYEDIGLTPNEIKYFLKDFGITTTKRNRELIKELREYRNLKMKGKLIKLTCKVGDIVYEANINRNIISSYRVKSIVLMIDSTYYNWELVNGIYSNLNGFNEMEIGEVVFLTQKEAAEALEEFD